MMLTAFKTLTLILVNVLVCSPLHSLLIVPHLSPFLLSEDACQLGYHPCNTDATCTIVNNTNPVCSCGPCYEGDGVECNPEECPFISMECDESTGDCVCGEDYSTSTNDGDPCIREGMCAYNHFKHLRISLTCCHNSHYDLISQFLKYFQI